MIFLTIFCSAMNENINEELASNDGNEDEGITYLTLPTQLEFVDPQEEAIDEYYEIVTINDLEEKDYVEKRNCDNEQLLVLCVLYWKRKQKDGPSSKDKTFYGRGGRVANIITYDRMLFCWDVFASPGRNVITFLFGARQNNNFFATCYNLRETEAFSKQLRIAFFARDCTLF